MFWLYGVSDRVHATFKTNYSVSLLYREEWITAHTLSFSWSGWRQSKFKLNWSRSLVIGDNGLKKDVFKLIVQHSKRHQFAFLFLKDSENDIHFVIWKVYSFNILLFSLWRNVEEIWILFTTVCTQLNSLYQGLYIENGAFKKHSQTKNSHAQGLRWCVLQQRCFLCLKFYFIIDWKRRSICEGCIWDFLWDEANGCDEKHQERVLSVRNHGHGTGEMIF